MIRMNSISTSARAGSRRARIGAAAALLAFWCACSRDERREPEAYESEAAEEAAEAIKLDAEVRERIGLETADARLMPLAGRIRTTGIVGPNESRVARVRALSSGVITEVMVRKGDRVRAGEALLVYDNVELGEAEAEYRTALAELERARSEAEVTRLALERADELVDIGGIAPAEQQRRRAEHSAASAAVRTYEAQLRNLQQKLARFGVSDEALKDLETGATAYLGPRSSLRAPFDGVVLDVEAVAGETVMPERELATVADLTTVWIQGDLYERDLAAVTEGGEARASVDAFPGEIFTGRVTYVSDFLDPATRTAKVRCEMKNPNGRLRLSMFARVEIPAGSSRETLVIPQDALQRLDGEDAVFVRTSEDRFEKRTVTAGERLDEWVEILAGLTPGERVVTTGALMLKSKMKLGEFAESEEEEGE